MEYGKLHFGQYEIHKVSFYHFRLLQHYLAHQSSIHHSLDCIRHFVPATDTTSYHLLYPHHEMWRRLFATRRNAWVPPGMQNLHDTMEDEPSSNRLLSHGKFKLNEGIRSNQVQIVCNDTKKLSMPMRLSVALKQAHDQNMDLVQIHDSPLGVCKIMDFRKYLYKESKMKKSKPAKTKEVSLSVTIGDHDRETKVKKIRGFLNKNHPVKVCLKWQRNTFHALEDGKKMFTQVLDSLKDVGIRSGSDMTTFNKIAVLVLPHHKK